MSSFCELCGTKLTLDKKNMVIVDGSVFTVCLSCSKHGKPYNENKSSIPSKTTIKNKFDSKTYLPPQKTQFKIDPSKRFTNQSRIKNTNSIIKKPSSQISMNDNSILNPQFSTIIREARMKKGLTQDQLANQLNEKVTIIKKFETGSIKPDEILANKLQRFLGIKLYYDISDDYDDNT